MIRQQFNQSPIAGSCRAQLTILTPQQAFMSVCLAKDKRDSFCCCGSAHTVSLHSAGSLKCPAFMLRGRCPRKCKSTTGSPSAMDAAATKNRTCAQSNVRGERYEMQVEYCITTQH